MNPPRSRAGTLAIALGLLALNLSICWRLLFLGYTNFFGSVEPFFYAIAHGIRTRWPDLGWWPQWNLGMPFDYTYQPLLHHLVAATGALFSLSDPRAYHIVVAILCAFGPVSLYLLALHLTAKQIPSLVAAVLYSLLSPSAWLIAPVAQDLGGFWHPRRLQTVFAYADGPNVVGLTFLPLAILFLDRALKRGTAPNWALAAIAIAIVPLINIPATIALAFAIIAYAMSLDGRGLLRRYLQILGICATGYLLFCCWLPPSGLLLTLRDIRVIQPAANFSADKLPYYALVILGSIAIRFLLKRVHLAIRFAAIFFWITSVVTLSSFWRNIDLIAEPRRFHVAMEMPIILLLVLAIAFWVRWTPLLQTIAALFLIVVCSNIWVSARRFVRADVRNPEITSRSEYKIAQWFQNHAGGDRVYATGSTAYWLNAWTETPQARGCCLQNRLLDMERSAEWEMDTDMGAGDRVAEISVAWLQILGVHYIAVNGPRSTDLYKDIQHPKKFDGVLREAWRDGDDVIYEVPLATASLAHVVRADELAARAPINGIDIEPFDGYRRALLDPTRPKAAFRWLNSHEASIEGTLPAGTLLSVQIPFHPGWRATGGTIGKDALGFLTIAPTKSGPCHIRLTFDGGSERRILRLIAAAAWLFLAIFLIRTAVTKTLIR